MDVFIVYKPILGTSAIVLHSFLIMTTHLRRCTEKQKNHSEIRNLEYLLKHQCSEIY